MNEYDENYLAHFVDFMGFTTNVLPQQIQENGLQNQCMDNKY